MSLSGTSIPPTDAIKRAGEALREMVPDAANVRLEEISLSDDDRRWRITLTFTSKAVKDDLSPLEEMLGIHSGQRRARIIEIDARDGHFKGMKLRRAI